MTYNSYTKLISDQLSTTVLSTGKPDNLQPHP